MNTPRSKWTGARAKHRARHLLSPARQAQAADLLRWAALDLPPDSVAVDLGAGSGLLTVLLAQRLSSGHAVAVDVSPELLERLEERATRLGLMDRIKLQRAPADATGLPAGTVRVVSTAMLLHEVPDPSAVLAEAFRLLRPGGQLLIRDFVARRFSFIARWHHPGPAYGHLGSTDLAERVKRAGFDLRNHRIEGAMQDLVAFKPA
ncbi:MAG: class I SAM-dependent methyltransferase [Pseudomonadota bacterium]